MQSLVITVVQGCRYTSAPNPGAPGKLAVIAVRGAASPRIILTVSAAFTGWINVSEMQIATMRVAYFRRAMRDFTAQTLVKAIEFEPLQEVNSWPPTSQIRGL